MATLTWCQTNLVHKGLVNIFALFTRNWPPSWILTFVSSFIICPCAVRNLNKSKMASRCWVTTHQCNHALAVGNIKTVIVANTAPVKFSTAPARNLTLILVFKILNGLVSKFPYGKDGSVWTQHRSKIRLVTRERDASYHFPYSFL